MEGQRSQLSLELPDLPLLEETDATEVAGLVWEALGRLTGSDERAALWRLVDAAGLLAEQFPDDLTAREGTDRGFRIVRARRGLAVSPEWLQAPGDPDLARIGQYQCVTG
jgi:hypothetical protein